MCVCTCSQNNLHMKMSKASNISIMIIICTQFRFLLLIFMFIYSNTFVKGMNPFLSVLYLIDRYLEKNVFGLLHWLREKIMDEWVQGQTTLHLDSNNYKRLLHPLTTLTVILKHTHIHTCIHLDWLENNKKILHIYEVCSKNNETEAVFTKIEINNEWNINFLQSRYHIICVER